MSVQVRPASKADVAELSEVLGRSFYDDPVLSWMLPDDDFRRRKIGRFFRAITLATHLRKGGCEVAIHDRAIGGATLWDPPGQWKDTVLSTLTLAPRMLLLFGRHLDYVGRAARMEEQVTKAHPDDEPHWYLSTIGTDPSARGIGLGSALLDSRLSRCDDDNVAAYLESSKESNIAYYERFGFKVTGEIELDGGGPILYSMWRTPRP